ncbi:alpha-D-ribose 1-methylphosphonate 5-phosphate C-P-lyase PhnJ [Escherichia coli]
MRAAVNRAEVSISDHPFTVQQCNQPCAICGSTHSYLDEVVLDDAETACLLLRLTIIAANERGKKQ